MRAAAACALAGILAGTANAAPANDRCAGSADEAALLRCRQQQFDIGNSSLRQAVDSLRQRYQDDEPERAKLLATAQQAWRGFMQAECKFRTSESASGTAYPVYLLSCMTEMNAQRLRDLKLLLANP
jgi:uncharacterized protein YecT (DUF1311 family)